MTTPTPSNTICSGWPVKVYRRTKDRGWETAETQRQTIYASPCVGGVEIRQFRVRIRVFKETMSSVARCTKRRNLLYLSTRSQTGSIVLQFNSVTAANDFFDELLDLNGRKIGRSTEVSSNPSPEVMNDEDLQRHKQDTLSYLARLLHDNDFQDFVKNVEKSLTSSEDGAKMLAAFQASDDAEFQV